MLQVLLTLVRLTKLPATVVFVVAVSMVTVWALLVLVVVDAWTPVIANEFVVMTGALTVIYPACVVVLVPPRFDAVSVTLYVPGIV